jgi:heptosyltransferase-2
VRGTNWLGDAVMTTPALLRLREKFPSARITILTPEKLADLWKNHPAIDDIFAIAQGEGIWSVAHRLRLESLRRFLESSPGMGGAGKAAYQETAMAGGTLAKVVAKVVTEVSKATIDAAKQPAKQAIDLALVLPNSPRSALEVFLARIPQRIGYARPWRNLFLTQTVVPRAEAVKMHKRSVPEIQQLVAHASGPASVNRVCAASPAHQIHEYLHLAAALGANPEPLPPQLFVTPEEMSAARTKFGLDNRSGPVFGLNPGAEYGPAKRWPAERFIAAARAIQKQTNCVWLIFGGQHDEVVAGQIQSAIGNRQLAVNLAGQTTLRELMALLKLCRVLLTNDTGPMHVAAALGTPVVVPFGSTSPELTGPGLPGDSRHHLLKSNAPCSPCFLRECPIDFRCLTGIEAGRVVEVVLEAVKR